jgi:Na+-driven multidrug efflux pump
MWHRPWRWVIAALGAVLIMGLINLTAQALGFSEFFGAPTEARVGLLGALTAGLTTLVLPSPEEMDRGGPLPPLPSMQHRPRSQSTSS